MSSCVSIPVQLEQPSDHFEIDYIDNHIGTSKQNFVEKLGVPPAVLSSGEQTHYIYDATGDLFRVGGFAFVVPPYFLPIMSGKESGEALHCLALTFDERGVLQSYQTETASEDSSIVNYMALGFLIFSTEITNCINAFWDEEELRSMQPVASEEELSSLGISPVDQGVPSDIILQPEEETKAPKITLEKVEIQPVKPLAVDDQPLSLETASAVKEVTSHAVTMRSSRPRASKITQRKEDLLTIEQLRILRSAKTGNVASKWHAYRVFGHTPEGFRWLCSAADDGHTQARMALGYLFSSGAYGFTQNYSKSYVWYRLAGSAEQRKAVDWYLKKLKKRRFYCTEGRDCFIAREILQLQGILRPQGVLEAEKLLEQWQPGQCEDELLQSSYSQ